MSARCLNCRRALSGRPHVIKISSLLHPPCRPAPRKRLWTIALYSLPSCFFNSFPGIFDFVAGNGICLLAATAPALAEFALSLPPCFLTSIPEVFDFGTGSDFCLPAAISPALSKSALPLPFCFLSSMSGVFDLGVGDNGCSPALAEFILPLPSCFLTSIPVIFGFGADSGFSLPAAISEICFTFAALFLRFWRR